MKGLLLAFALMAAGCSRSNNLLLGRVESTVGTHPVVVTDCYRTRVAPPQQMGATDYSFMPCRDADIRIRNEQLTVNGVTYGNLRPKDGVLVDHGVVSIQRAQ
jgi:hypothetical protein